MKSCISEALQTMYRKAKAEVNGEVIHGVPTKDLVFRNQIAYAICLVSHSSKVEGAIDLKEHEILDAYIVSTIE